MCKEEEQDMGTIFKPQPVKSTEINFNSDKEYEDFIKLINNPPEPSDFVKNLIKQYQKQSRDN